MIVAAAVCPSPPLLIPELTGAQAGRHGAEERMPGVRG